MNRNPIAAAPFIFLLILLAFLAGQSGCASSGDDDEAVPDDAATDPDDDQTDDDLQSDDTGDDTMTDDDDDTFEPGSEFIVMVPMRDAVRLRTKIFLPDHITYTGAATMMARTPYRSPDGNAEYEKRARVFKDEGYAFVLQDCRGRNESEGVFTPYTNENNDAIDTSEWIASQAWSNGRIGTIGMSYDAYTALVAAADNPAVTVVLAEDPPSNETGPHKFGGAVSKGRLEWLFNMKYGRWMSDEEITQATNMLDVAGADLAIVGDSIEYWAAMVGNPDPADPVWQEHDMLPYYPGICAPVLTIEDIELQWSDPVANWTGLRELGCEEERENQRLVMTPDPHGYHTFALPYLKTPPNELMLLYADRFLGLKDVDVQSVPTVQYRSADDVSYRSSETWPPSGSTKTYHLDRNGGLGYLSDGIPADPTPEILTLDPATTDPCGDAYPFMLFESDILLGGTYIAGTPSAEIWVSASTPDADLFLDLKEYPLLGEPRLIACAQTRLRYRDGDDDLLSPGEVVHVALDMFPVPFSVRSGARIALEIRPAHCGFFENPHTGEELGGQTHWAPSTLTIYHDAARPSSVTLPLL